MVKKTLLAALILLGLQFCETTSVCFADVSAQLEQAETCQKSGDNQQAEQIYKAIAADYPGTADALQAQRLLLKMYITGRRSLDTQDTVDKLIADFSGEPNLPKELHEIAKECEWSRWGSYEDAKYVYQKIAQYYPDSSYGNKAQLEIPKMDLLYLIADQSYEQAATAFNKLTTDFSRHPNFAETLYDIARRYEWRLQHDMAVNVNQQLISQYPDCWWVENARLAVLRNTIMGLIASERDSEIPAVIEGLTEQFAGHMDFPKVLYDIAERYELAGKKEEAEGLYRQVINQYSENHYADRSRLKVSKMDVSSLIQPGDLGEVQATIDNLIDKYGDNEGLSHVIFYVGEQYYKKAFGKQKEGLDSEAKDNFRNALSICNRIKTELSSPFFTAEAYYLSGDCHRQLGEYEESIECYEKIVDDYPGHSLAWNALFMVGRNTESLEKSGVLPKSESEPKIKAVYKQVVEKYPDCKAAKVARNWLNRHNSK